MEFKIINETTYRRHGIFLWRYFDLHKFFSFLHNKEIRFTRMDEFEDPLEGVPLRALITYAEEKDLELIGEESLSDFILDRTKFRKLSKDMQDRITSIKNSQQNSFVSCWFLSERESMAMWNIYSNPDGVAIKVPARNLFRHFDKYPAEFTANKVSAFYAGKVVYQNFKNIDPEDDSLTVQKIG